MPPLHCANSTSAAKLFLQLCARRSNSIAPICPTTSILDVLLPPRARAFHLPTTAARKSSSPASPAMTTIAIPSRAGYFAAPQRRRGFASTGTWRKTQVIHNPQKDEDGNVMLLEITPRAAKRLSQIMAKDENPHLALRIQVESGGCHGFQYLMSLTTLPPSPGPSPSSTADALAPSTTTSSTPSAPQLSPDDTVFGFVKDDADPSTSPIEPPPQEPGREAQKPFASTAGMPKVILDGPSLELLKGSKVDFTMELIGSQFKIVDNPLATSSCGCGTSFDIKF
ncbi:hypothetical protein F4810DRAFT_538079 [Camillea tinctor]|nr:hypothetical protein F4810DRAFT_538079 [Camillea tinctor]